jgi:sporulation protein YlmC with PRC-barrel domain
VSEATAGETTEFTIGREVACSDGVCGDLRRLLVDPAVREVTHLAVASRHRRYMGRLVPIDLVEVTGEEIRLRCTMSEFEALEEADEISFTPGAGGKWAFGPSLGAGLGGGLGGMGMVGMGMENMGPGPQAVASDRVPTGEVEVQRGDHVHATDGDIGRVQGLVVDSRDHRVRHVLLAEGHLWGQKRVAIPISAVQAVDDGVRLNLTKDQVRDLPAVYPGHSE